MGLEPIRFRTRPRPEADALPRALSTILISYGRFNQHRTMMGGCAIASRKTGKNKLNKKVYIGNEMVYKKISKCVKPMFRFYVLAYARSCTYCVLYF